MAGAVERPLWRLFPPARVEAAVRHARAGGLAVISGRRWRLVGDAGPEGAEVPLFVDWAIRAVESPEWRELSRGPARGCVVAPVPADWRERVREWVARDAAYPGATAKASFDCLRCAACCVDNVVVLDEEDRARLRSAGRADLLRSAKRRGRALLLPLLPTPRKECVHLRRDLRCGIYALRPNMCREFPAGSEQCMTSREEVFGTAFPPGR